MVLWAFPDVTTLSRAQAEPTRFPRYQAWMRTAQKLERSHAGLVLRPTWWSYVK
jgi:hypothetical protein